jgi:signal transduction histidine kinase
MAAVNIAASVVVAAGFFGDRLSTASPGQALQVFADNGHGFDAADLPPGHGLALLEDRLAMIFESRASLEIDSRPGRTSVVMDLPES